jgi:diguanylate cyclase (GGDEF)-like protein
MRVIVDERLMGSLLHDALPDALIESTFTKRLHEQLAQSLLIVLEAERVRRQAAADRALALISALSNTYTEDNLVEVASALSALPNACGCHLVMENQRFSGPVRVVAGSMDGFGDHWRHRYTLDNRVGLTIEISWATETTSESATHLEEICDTLREALDRIEQNVRLQEEVETDALTGVGNRRRAVRMLAAARSQAERRGESTAVMMMDLDHFKKVNDMLGHDAGDRVLMLFGHMLSDTVRGYDTVARWGGEEFVIICPETDNAGAAALAHRILENTPKACAPALPDEWIQTVSIGIATYPAVADTPDALLREADRALYTAKSLGRNRFIRAGRDARAKNESPAGTQRGSRRRGQ